MPAFSIPRQDLPKVEISPAAQTDYRLLITDHFDGKNPPQLTSFRRHTNNRDLHAIALDHYPLHLECVVIKSIVPMRSYFGN